MNTSHAHSQNRTVILVFNSEGACHTLPDAIIMGTLYKLFNPESRQESWFQALWDEVDNRALKLAALEEAATTMPRTISIAASDYDFIAERARLLKTSVEDFLSVFLEVYFRNRVVLTFKSNSSYITKNPVSDEFLIAKILSELLSNVIQDKTYRNRFFSQLKLASTEDLAPHELETAIHRPVFLPAKQIHFAREQAIVQGVEISKLFVLLLELYKQNPVQQKKRKRFWFF